MCCLAFFDFLRESEFTIPADSTYNSACHLSLNDIAVDSRVNPCLLQVLLKQSKTDPFKHGVKVYLGITSSFVCLVKAVLSHLKQRSIQPPPWVKIIILFCPIVFNYWLTGSSIFCYLVHKPVSGQGRNLVLRGILHSKYLLSSPASKAYPRWQPS